MIIYLHILIEVLKRTQGVFLTFLFIGCVHNYILTQKNKWEFYNSLEEELNGRKAKATLLDGENLNIYSAEIYTDGENEFISFTHEKSGEYEEYPVEIIKEIRIRNRLEGGVQGMLIGMGGGLIIGAVLGLAGVKLPPCEGSGECENYSRGMKAVIFGSLYSIGGGITGAGIGGAKGTSSIYNFKIPDEFKIDENKVIIEEYEE